jgi:hypothetical protein
MKKPSLTTRQRLLVLRLWLQRQISTGSSKKFEFTVFPRPAGPLQPPITLCVEQDGSIAVFGKFAHLLEYYAKTTATRPHDHSDSKLRLSSSVASLVEVPRGQNRANFCRDAAKRIRTNLASVKTKAGEQRASGNKQALSEFINFLPHQVIRMRGELVETGYSRAYRCQKSQFNPIRAWAISATRGDMIFGKALNAEHTDRADNGIVDVLEEIKVYADRYVCRGDLSMPPFLYACLVAPFPIAYAAISTLKLDCKMYTGITSRLREKVNALIDSAKEGNRDRELDKKYLCAQPSDRHVRVEWTMEAMETLGDGGELSVKGQFEEIQDLIQSEPL